MQQFELPMKTSSAKSVIYAVLAAVAIMASTAACQKQQAPIEVKAPRSLEVVRVQKQILDRVDQLPAEILAYQDVAIYPKVPGFVKSIDIDRGSVVKKGQTLVTMYAPEYLAQRNEALAKVEQARAKFRESEAELVSAQAQLREAKAKFKADESTYARLKAASLVPGVVATNEVVILGQQVDADAERIGSWESKVAATANSVAAARDSLAAANRSADNFKDFASYLTITAPFDGYITERNMHVGSFVGPLGQGAYPPIARIQELQLLRIVVPVPERDTAGILPGAKVSFSVSSFPEERFTGTVARIGNYLDKSTRTMPVELNYWNADYKIFPGAFCRAYWPTRRRAETLFVPLSAVVTTTLESYVCKIANGAIQWVKVNKGQNMGNLVEVFGDLSEGDMVALTGSEELRPGTAVTPVLASNEDISKTPVPRPHYHISPNN